MQVRQARSPAPAGVPAQLPERGPQRSLGARRSPGSAGIPCLVLVWLEKPSAQLSAFVKGNGDNSLDYHLEL